MSFVWMSCPLEGENYSSVVFCPKGEDAAQGVLSLKTTLAEEVLSIEKALVGAKACVHSGRASLRLGKSPTL